MTTFFSQILNMSLTGSIVIVLVILARLFLRKSPKIYSYLLWGVVLFRLLCPVSFTAPVSVLSAFEPAAQEVTQTVSTVSFLPQELEFSEPVQTMPLESEESEPLQHTQTQSAPEIAPIYCASLVWAAGGAVLILYSVIQVIHLRIKLIGAVKYRGGIYLADHLDTAFVYGIFAPKIYIPSSVPATERRFILAHEQHHIRRGDHIAKLAGFLAVCIHWFNPLVWVAFALAGKDMEMSCDEAVIRKLGPEIRGDYAQALLKFTTNRQLVPGMPLAFGEGDTKARVKNMAKWKRPKVWVSLVCLLLCVVVVGACGLNPEKKIPLEEMTRVQGPVSVGVDELEFTLPATFSMEVQEQEGLPNSDPQKYLRLIRKQDTIAGGVYILSYPDENSDRPMRSDWDWVSALNVPEKVPEERFLLSVEGNYFGVSGSWDRPYTAHASYGKNGIEETAHYFFPGENYVYDLWFDMQIVTESEKTGILNSIKGSSGSDLVPYELGYPFAFLPDEYGYKIESPHSGRITSGTDTIGGISVYKIPDGFKPDDYLTLDFLKALGIPEATQENLGWFTESSSDGGWTAELFHDVPQPEEGTLRNLHRFYPTQDGYLFDVWFDLLKVDQRAMETILDCLTISEINRIQTQSISDSSTPMPQIQLPFQITDLPEGYRYDVLGENCILFLDSKDVVGGLDVFAIPEAVYDPYDDGWFWLEEMGLADFEDETLAYIGGMTSGEHGWLAEFASDVPDGMPVTVHRRHVYRVVDKHLYDIWLDMNLLTYDTANEIAYAVKWSQIPAEAHPAAEQTPEEIAFALSSAVMEAVSQGSAHIVSRQTNEGSEGPSGYAREFWYHDGDFLCTNRVLPAGENITEAGEYYNRSALLVVKDEFYTNEGNQGKAGEIIWEKSQPTDPVVPWLGNRIWVKSFVSYMGTVENDSGICCMFRYDKPYEDRPDYDGHYFVNFNFDHSGNFQSVQLQVNLFRENEFTVTESIVTLDPDRIAGEIQAEYARAIS